MYCPYCGKEVADQIKFCPYCGQPMPQGDDGPGNDPGNSYPDNSGADRDPENTEWGAQRREQQDEYADYGAREDEYPDYGIRKDEYDSGRDAYGEQDRFGYSEGPKRKRTWLIVVIIAAAAAAALLLYTFVFAGKGFGGKKDNGSTGTAVASSSGESPEEAVSGSSVAAESSSMTNALQADNAEAEGFDAIAALTGEKTGGNLKFVSSDVSDYPNVRLYYSMTDDSGQPLELSSPTAGIKETISGGSEIERTVRSIEKLDGNQGLSIDIVADKSSSMDSDMPAMKNAMTQFVNSLDYASGDEAELISFDSYIMYMCTYTNDASRLQNGINNMSTYGDTALYDALVTGINDAGSKAGAKCVIGFTDGEDNRSTNTPDSVISLANQKEVPVYIIGTASADSSTLQNIANSTGGSYWSIDSVSDMSGVMEQIYSTAKDLYCVEYESDANADPYTERTVSCVVADENYGGESNNVSFTPTRPVTEAQHSSRYEVVKKDISWTDANNECLAKGGHLVTITSDDEMKQVSQLAESAGVKYCWIGGYTSVENGQAYGHWITGEDFNSYTAWYPGEPSRNDKDGTPEFYMMLWNVKGQWSWNDQRDDVLSSGLAYFKGNTGYIIEYED